MSLEAVTRADGSPILWVPSAQKDSVEGLLFWVREAISGGPEARRRITENHPLLFALVYLSHHLKSKETGWLMSLCQMHLDMAEEAMQWRFDWGPGEYRVAFVGPRDIGKSTWCFLILPAWAMAHGWRDTVVMFSSIDSQAKRHFRNLKREFEQNPLLRMDYPELCTPGPEEVDNASEYISIGGHSMACSGLESDVLGFKNFNKRPNLIICDDIEKTGAKYTLGNKAKRLQILLEEIFPMNLNACFIMIGTVTRYGAIMHEVVRAASGGETAEWIAEEHIDCRYYPAVVRDEKTGREESIWPQRWTYDYMRSQRHTRLFQLGMMNMPTSQHKGFWTREDWKYDWPFQIETQILAIDPAVKYQEINDPTGIAVIGFDPPKQNALVQWAEAVWLDPDGMRRLIRHILHLNPLITHVIIEDNNGGEYVTRQLASVIPKRIIVVPKFEDVSKLERVKELHDWTQQGWVYNAPGVHAFVEQAQSYPEVDHDDIVDAVAKGVRYHLQHRPLPFAA